MAESTPMEEQIVVGCQNRMTIRIRVVHDQILRWDKSTIAVLPCGGLEFVPERRALQKRSFEQRGGQTRVLVFSTLPDYSRVVTKFVLRWCD